MNNKMYIINIMCTQTHRRWENRRNVFNSRSDKSEVLKMCFLCSFEYVRLGPCEVTMTTRAGEVIISVAHIERRVGWTRGRRERERERMKWKKSYNNIELHWVTFILLYCVYIIIILLLLLVYVCIYVGIRSRLLQFTAATDEFLFPARAHLLLRSPVDLYTAANARLYTYVSDIYIYILLYRYKYTRSGIYGYG